MTDIFDVKKNSHEDYNNFVEQHKIQINEIEEKIKIITQPLDMETQFSFLRLMILILSVDDCVNQKERDFLYQFYEDMVSEP